MKFDKHIPFNKLKDLPPKSNLETVPILKATIRANKLLAELKGFCQTLPQPELLLNTIILQESKESNAIENIVTTQDELYKSTLMGSDIKDTNSKEVLQYREAMYWAKNQLEKHNIITTNMLIGIMQRIRNSTDSMRINSGTKIVNPISKDVIYTPPEGENVLREKLAKLEVFINDDTFSDIDPLIKMALIHYQFEAIHPFRDGNGRTGRILNVVYLLHQNLLGLPVLYLSRYIIENKSDYYRLLKEVTEKGNWAEWVLYVINGVAETSKIALAKINEILTLKNDIQADVKNKLPQIFSMELVNLLFSYPYIKINVLEENKIAKRQTASQYLKKISEIGWLSPLKIGKEVYFINDRLVKILSK